MKKLIFGLLTLTTLGTLTAPALADQVIMQESDNYIYQEGTGNSGQQTTRQIHRSYKRGGNQSESSYGGIQTSVQEGAQFGGKNEFEQITIQKNEMRTGRGSRTGR